MENANIHTIDTQSMHNMDYWTIDAFVSSLRTDVIKREKGEMWINISESKQFIEKYEAWKISKQKQEQYAYHKTKMEAYIALQADLIYHMELMGKFNQY